MARRAGSCGSVCDDNERFIHEGHEAHEEFFQSLQANSFCFFVLFVSFVDGLRLELPKDSLAWSCERSPLEVLSEMRR